MKIRHKMYRKEPKELKQIEKIKSKLDAICSSRELDENNEKVTISKGDFNWLTYGIDELLEENKNIKSEFRKLEMMYWEVSNELEKIKK